MAAQRGKLLILKVGNGASPEVFTTIGGMKTNSMTVNNNMVDITTKDSNGWRELLDSAGISNMSLSGSGIFVDDATGELLRSNAFSQGISNYKIEFNNGDYLTGAFMVTSYERTGAHDDAEQFTVSLESAGIPVFTTA